MDKDFVNHSPSQIHNMHSNMYHTRNGNLIGHQKEIKLRSCPWTELVSLWALMFFLAVSVPFLATHIPPEDRTDINWWMTGVVYQFPQPREGQTDYFTEISSQIDRLRSLGITSVRLSRFFKQAADGAVLDYYQPNEAYGSTADFEELIEVCDRLSMRIIIDIPVGHTSISHDWFQQDKKDHALYTWSTKQLDQDESDDNVDPKEVLHYWLDKGIDGVILLDYDSINFINSTQGDQFNHIDMSDPVEKKLNNLASLTKYFRRYINSYREDIIFFGLEVTSKDVKTWHMLCESGADMVINHELEGLTKLTLTNEVSAITLRNKVKRSLNRVPFHTFKNWQICNENDKAMKHDQLNTQNLLTMVHLLLPGSAFLCPTQIPTDQEYTATQHFKTLLKWRMEASMSWGDTETTYFNEQVFSFARFAFGKKLRRYLVITNFGEEPERQNFTLIRKGLKILDTGILQHYTCPEGVNPQISNNLGNLIYLNETLVHGRCGLLIELIL